MADIENQSSQTELAVFLNTLSSRDLSPASSALGDEANRLTSPSQVNDANDEQKKPKSIARAWQYVGGSMPLWNSWIYAEERATIAYKPVRFLDQVFRGVGQVVFLDNPLSGLLITIGMFLGNPLLGLFSLVGVISSTIHAHLLGLNEDRIRRGLFGFNGQLVGCAIATFLITGTGVWQILLPLVATIVFSMLSVIIQLALAQFLSPFKFPALTLPFNFALTMLLLGSQSYAYFPSSLGSLPPSVGVSVLGILTSWMRGISQVFLVSNPISGIIISAAMLISIPQGLASALLGSAIGISVGYGTGTNPQLIEFGLLGYNPVLAGMALYPVFLKMSVRSFFLSIYAMIFTALLQVPVSNFLAVFGLPTLTFPFCLATILFGLARTSIPHIHDP